MIATKFRVEREKITFILKKGNQIFSKFFIIRYTANNLNFPRFRVIVSKKMAFDAVERNKMRRRVYEAVRLIQEEIKEPNDFILIPKKAVKSASFTQLTEDLKEAIYGKI